VKTAFILFQMEIAVEIIGTPSLPGSMENLFHITTTTNQSPFVTMCPFYNLDANLKFTYTTNHNLFFTKTNHS
jgi:hypothetical protein